MRTHEGSVSEEGRYHIGRVTYSFDVFPLCATVRGHCVQVRTLDGCPVALLQLLSHADIAMTTIYTQISADGLVRMMGTPETLQPKTEPHLSTLRLQGFFLNAGPERLLFL